MKTIPTMMKAAVYTRYGPPNVVEIKDVATPLPGPNDVLVRIHATTVAAADWRLRKADPPLVRVVFGLRRPKRIQILGTEFAGVVEAVGDAVTKFAIGDQVFGAAGFTFGAHAQYIRMNEAGQLSLKPHNMSFDEAAAVLFGGGSALHFIKKANIQPGQNVLVYGGSGSVGVFTVQLLKHMGTTVTAVCSTANLDLMKSLGADHVVDYTKEDFAAAGQVYDVVFDAVGKATFDQVVRSLKQGGVYVQVSGDTTAAGMVKDIARTTWMSMRGRAKVVGGVVKGTADNTALLKELIEAGKVRTVIDRRYPLEEIVAAHAHAESGHKKGHVVVTVS